jgi:hypothetical protein
MVIANATIRFRLLAGDGLRDESLLMTWAGFESKPLWLQSQGTRDDAGRPQAVA